jgi:hypothetical protein
LGTWDLVGLGPQGAPLSASSRRRTGRERSSWRASRSPALSVWSASPVAWRRMERLGIRPVQETTLGGQPPGRFYRIPLSRFRWGLKRTGAV